MFQIVTFLIYISLRILLFQMPSARATPHAARESDSFGFRASQTSYKTNGKRLETAL